MLVAMLIEDMVSGLGHQVIGPAHTLEAGLALAAEADIDFAILDINLGSGAVSFPIADLLMQRGIPFAFATGYDRDRIAARYDATALLRKPFTPDQLLKVLSSQSEG